MNALCLVSYAMVSGSVECDGVLRIDKMDIYVGNLPYTATEEDVSGLFAAYGSVERVKIIMDRETGRSKGFAFVTLSDQSQLNASIEALNGYDYQGRALRVNASEPQAPRPGGSSRPSGGGGYGGGGGVVVVVVVVAAAMAAVIVVAAVAVAATKVGAAAATKVAAEVVATKAAVAAATKVAAAATGNSISLRKANLQNT